MKRSGVPFVIALAVALVLTVALFRLPESFVHSVQTGSPLDSSEAGVAFGLLALAATAQALYGGFFVLRPERLHRALREDPALARAPRERALRTTTAAAAFMVVLTIVYGLAAFALSGQRGGYWLFVVIALVQAGWYYLQTGRVAQWLAFQPQPPPDRPPAWQPEPPDYCPPLARGLTGSAPPSVDR